MSAIAGDFPPKGRLATATHATLGDRTYLIQPVEGGGRFPVVILLHGGTQTAETVWTQTSLPVLAARDKFILVAPQGVGKHWNDGRGSTIAADGPSTADDVAFLHALIQELIRSQHADPARVFMTGISNGGFMTLRFACESARDLRAAGNIISTLTAACRPSKPLPWFSMNGTDDPLIPFAGQPGGVVRRGGTQPALLSADATFSFWADRAGCGKDVHTERLPSRGASSSWVEKRIRTGCAGGAQSVQYVIHGAGHTIPNSREGIVVRMLGGSNQDIDAGEEIWKFFQATIKP